MNYLTVYKKGDIYYYETVTFCNYEIGYVNGLGKELVSIEIYHNGRFYSIEDHERIINERSSKVEKKRRIYKKFKDLLYVIS